MQPLSYHRTGAGAATRFTSAQNQQRSGHPRKPEQLTRQEIELAKHDFWGIDKDAFLARVSKAYMALIGDGRGSVFCHNSLETFDDCPAEMRNAIQPGTFDVVLTNPPFGKKIVVQGKAILGQFELGSRWNYDTERASGNPTDKLRDQVPPQVLFLERCIQLLRPGGRLGIVLPESIFGNPSHAYIIEWLKTHVRIDAVISIPEALFKTSGKGGTHTKVCILLATRQATTKKDRIFLAEAQWCGHDSRGNRTKRQGPDGETQRLDDIPVITKRMKAWRRQPRKLSPDALGFVLPHDQINRNVLIPRYYNPEIPREMERLAAEYELTPLGDLVNNNTLSFQTGVKVGKMAYGTGSIPFIRTSDLANWEIKRDFKHGVSERTYRQFKRKAPIKAGDLLLVKDGTYLIGTCGIVTEADLPMLYQSHLYRIQTLQRDAMSPWLLLTLLNTQVVRLQIRAKQFTQDIIDTIGRRILEVRIPIPGSAERARELSDQCRRIVETRIQLREEAQQPSGINRAPEINRQFQHLRRNGPYFED